MKILLLGGTGAMGAHLAKILMERGEDVFVTTRKSRQSTCKITYLQGDAHDNRFLETLLQDHWDAIVDFMVYNTTEFKARVDKLLQATTQYIYLSSSRVYADSKDPITEDSPRLLDVSRDKTYLATDEYALTKARQENILQESGSKNWTIIRPYITFSEIRLQLGVMEKESWLSRALRGQPIVFSKDIANKITTLTYGYDVAQGIAATCGEKRAFGEAFHITGNQSFTWDTVLDHYRTILEKELGHTVKIIMIEKALQLKHKGKYQVMYDRYYNRRFDNSKICQFMPATTFHNSLEELDRCLVEFLRNPIFNAAGVGLNAKLDRICGITMPLSAFNGWIDKVKYLLCRYILPL